MPSTSRSLKEHNIELNEHTNEDFQDIFSLMAKHHRNFGTSSLTKKKVLQRLTCIKTRTSWEAFLSTAGSSLALRHRTNLNIKVQPTSLSRRRVGITRGCKRLASGHPVKSEAAIKKKKKKLVTKCFPKPSKRRKSRNRPLICFAK